MPRSKAPAKKQQKRGIDFKKIKRKLGKKLPPPKNATNTEIKSKAIILPEQSVASEKAGFGVNKKGLTLKELLQQTSHHNPKVRKDALLGIRDFCGKHLEELRLHKYAVIEKLRERIGDDNKLVRETLYQLLKLVIFPACKEDNQGLFVSLLMTYIFNALTHLSLDVRLMAMKFLELMIQFYPPSFLLYAGKILQSYEDILRKNHLFLQEKGKLKNTLTGLNHCLSLLSCNKREDDSSQNVNGREGLLHTFEPEKLTESAGDSLILKKLEDLVPVLVDCFHEFKLAVHNMPVLDMLSFDCMLYILKSIDLAVGFIINETGKFNSESQHAHGRYDVMLKKLLTMFPLNFTHHDSERDLDRYFILNSVITEIFLHSRKYISFSDALKENFLQFIDNVMLGKVCSVTQSGKGVWERHILSLLPFIPRLISDEAKESNLRLLQSFTWTFKNCNTESSLILPCLSAIEEMLIPISDKYIDTSNQEILEHKVAWIRELPLLLILLGDKHPSCSKAVLRLQLRLGQFASINSYLAQEYDNMQDSLQAFFKTNTDEGSICYGPFTRLAKDIQELSICSLNYFSYLDPLLLKSIASCCLCPDLKPSTVVRIIEVLDSAYKVGHIQIANFISFCLTLLSQFRVFHENNSTDVESVGKISNSGAFKQVTDIICSSLAQMGDGSLVFQMLEKSIVDQISANPPVDNACALLRTLITLDSYPSRLSEQSIIALSNSISGYLIDVGYLLDVELRITREKDKKKRVGYYLRPCFLLFYRCPKLPSLVLKMMGALVTKSSLWASSRNCTLFRTHPLCRINTIVSVLELMHNEDEILIKRVMASFKAHIDCILQNILSLQSSSQLDMTIEERHRVQCAVDRLKKLTCNVSVGASSQNDI